MTDYDFKNSSSRAEREELLREASKPTTYSKLANLDAVSGGGRFAVEAGESKATDYPQQPSGPWSAQPGPGVEPPLGEDISFVAPVGEQWEIDASIAEQELGEPVLGAPQSRGPDQPLGTDRNAGSPPSQEKHEGASPRPRASDATEQASCDFVASTSSPKHEGSATAPCASMAEAGSNSTASVVKSQAVNSPACDETPRPTYSTKFKSRRKIA